MGVLCVPIQCQTLADYDPVSSSSFNDCKQQIKPPFLRTNLGALQALVLELQVLGNAKKAAATASETFEASVLLLVEVAVSANAGLVSRPAVEQAMLEADVRRLILEANANAGIVAPADAAIECAWRARRLLSDRSLIEGGSDGDDDGFSFGREGGIDGSGSGRGEKSMSTTILQQQNQNQQKQHRFRRLIVDLLWPRRHQPQSAEAEQQHPTQPPHFNHLLQM